MSSPRFFLEQALPDTNGLVRLPLSDADVHHASAVLRLRKGDDIEVVEPGGTRVWSAVIEQASSAGVDAVVTARLAKADGPKVTLVQGVAKGDKMDAIVRQAVEVGADGIMPALTERTVVKLVASKRVGKGERWRRVAKAAAEQSHRDSVPAVHDPAPLKELLPRLADFDATVVLWEESADPGIEAALASLAENPFPRIALVIGPEGGLSADEVAQLKSVGAVTATLGPSILRTETAAVVALTLAIHSLGGLGRG